MKMIILSFSAKFFRNHTTGLIKNGLWNLFFSKASNLITDSLKKGSGFNAAKDAGVRASATDLTLTEPGGTWQSSIWLLLYHNAASLAYSSL